MDKKHIDTDAFKTIIANQTPNDGKEDVDKYFTIIGGRGLINVLVRLLTEGGLRIPINLIGTVEIPKENRETIEYKHPKIFMSGWGHFEFKHDPKFDKNDETQKIEKFFGLPEHCYRGEIYYNKKFLGGISGLMDAPYKTVEDLVNKIICKIDYFNNELKELKQELQILTIDKTLN